MSPEGFDRLHESVRYHVVNTMGWPGLRPLQRESVVPIHEGRDCVLLAPTAGGKTEAATLPLLSRMLEEEWSGLSVLYLCPLRALANNLGPRLARYAGFVGRRAEVWHGDTGQGDRKRMRKDPPDILVTTPESVEAQLVSAHTNEEMLFGGVRTVVIDEVHAFAAADRGWHLLAVLSRLERLTGRPIQRIGLSATVGNPEEILAWLSPRRGSGPSAKVVNPASGGSAAADLKVDFVGSLPNAAQVISQLHRGEKRLVFVDSRQRAEMLGNELKRLEVQTFVSHSALGYDERRQAEKAFAEAQDCVIVATSTLELGIDVGDLDRVIQIDAPGSVASFLQRLGRTGRRAGAIRNCLFLATDHAALLRAIALLDLHERGFVEPVVPPGRPYHLLAQQVLAQILQHQGVSRVTWRDGLDTFLSQSGLDPSSGGEVLELLVSRQLLAEDHGIHWFTEQGERRLGGLNFLDLMSIFTSEDLFEVRHANREVGKVDRVTFVMQGGARPLLLGGRSWKILDIDWNRGVVSVEPTTDPGRSRWLGDGPAMSYELAQAIRRVVSAKDEPTRLSNRARAALSDARSDLWWFDPQVTTLHEAANGRVQWWTHGGTVANLRLAWRLQQLTGGEMRSDDQSIGFPDGFAAADALRLVSDLRTDPLPFDPAAFRPLAEKLKFYEALPDARVAELCEARYSATRPIERILVEPVRAAVLGGDPVRSGPSGSIRGNPGS
jgi:ATP-dependent Lhr-like helicase